MVTDPEGTVLYTGSVDHTIRSWYIKTGRILKVSLFFFYLNKTLIKIAKIRKKYFFIDFSSFSDCCL